MSRRMKVLSWQSLWLWIVGAMLVVSTLKADPPQPKPLPSPPESSEKDVRQIQFNVTVWDIDHAKLKALTKSELGVHEFYKANGLIKQPDWISATIGDAVSDLLRPHGAKPAGPKPLPLRATAVRREASTLSRHRRCRLSAY